MIIDRGVDSRDDGIRNTNGKSIERKRKNEDDINLARPPLNNPSRPSINQGRPIQRPANTRPDSRPTINQGRPIQRSTNTHPDSRPPNNQYRTQQKPTNSRPDPYSSPPKKKRINIDDALNDPEYVARNTSSIISQMFGYNRHRYVDEDSDIDDMEVGYSDVRKEEARRY